MTHDEDDGRQQGVSRARLVEVAQELVQRDGLDALTMRALADRLGVRPASLYWHVRDRGELVAMLARALLAEVRPPSAGAGWRRDALAACAALERHLGRRRDAVRIVLEAPDALEGSDVHARLRAILTGAGLGAGEAHETAIMMLAHVLIGATRAGDPPAIAAGRPVMVAIDTGSRGVSLRAGSGMTGLIRVAHDPGSAAPAAFRGDTVVVRRLRGGRQGALELNPAYPWRVKVQAPTWNTVLDLRGLDVRGVHVDSGAARVECVLPAPRGAVPIHIASGVAGVRIRRPEGVPVVARVGTGALRVRLDAFHVGAATESMRWESVEDASERDHYALEVSSGVVRVTLEADASISPAPVEAAPAPCPGPIAALEIVLDGVAARARRGGGAPPC